MNLNLKSNTIWSTAEVIVSGLALFVLFKYVVVFVGIKGLGLWSLVLATTSLARLGDLGAAAGLSRFVAIAMARGDQRQAGAYIDTAFITNLILYCVFGAVLYGPLRYGLSIVVPVETLAEARSLLPYAIASFVLLNLNSVMLSALIGYQRTDLKSKTVIASVFLQIAVVAVLISTFGLVAMAIGQIVQYGFTALTARLLFRRIAPASGCHLIPIGFSKTAFRDLLGFGLKLQAASLVSFAFEPLTKFVISATGGLEVLGVFEMAYRMVLQARHIIAAPLQALLPAFAHLDETDPSALRDLYEKAVVSSLLAGGTLLSLLALTSPLISWLWIGSVNTTFIAFAAICCLGWFVNLVAAPAYILGLSRGHIGWNVAGHVITSFAGPLAGFVLFKSFGGEETSVAAAMGGLAGGALLSWIMNCRRFRMPIWPSGQKFRNSIKMSLITFANEPKR